MIGAVRRESPRWHFCGVTRGAVGALLCLLFAGCAGWFSSAPVLQKGDRALHLWYRPANDEIFVIYRTPRGYDRDGVRQISHFLRDRRTGEVKNIDPQLLDFIADLRDRLALPADVRIEVTSGYRSAESNAKLRQVNQGTAKESLHVEGRAVDLRIPGLPGKAVAEIAKTMQRGGAALYPRSDHVHLDTGDIRTWSAR